ncbi:MAG TPA: hypothetical protein PK536_13940 [Ignavibacteria bacterium]|nr:hypothetical protein [Ignavibacteria bacterium]HRK00710.1 hypothetical protein [Ignavibacteria bacterium]
MNWKLILQLSLFGLLMGILSVFGLIPNGFELIPWIIIAVLSALAISKKTDKLIFTHAVIAGLFMGILTSVIQAVFFDTLLKNNPDTLDGFKEIPTAMEPQYVLLFTGPFIGIIFGLVIGLLAAVFKKRLK